MFGYLLFTVAVLGTGYAAYWDLRTTEVPDWISVATALTGISINVLHWLYTGNSEFIISSLVAGTGFFALGWIFFLTGVWGGADALVMGALGYAFPYLPEVFSPISVAPWPFPFTVLFNVFLVGTVYTMLYAVIQGFKDRNVMSEYFKDMKGYWRRMALIFIGYVAVLSGISYYFLPNRTTLYAATFALQTSPILIGMLMIYRYLRIVEDHGMTKQVQAEQLEPGDVIGEDVETDDGVINSDKIVGLTSDQVEQIKNCAETVVVKRGVMFVPAFPIAVLLSVTVGDIIHLLLL